MYQNIYAIVSNGTITKYPANPAEENINVSFPLDWGGGEVNGVQYVRITPTMAPIANLGWAVTEDVPVHYNGAWYQSWKSMLKPKEEIKTEVSTKRYTVEVGSVVVANNKYATDRESQTKYVAVAFDIQQQANVDAWSIAWKTTDNKFVNLNASQMSQVINVVRTHVQQCFDKEAEYYQLIDTANTAVLETTDFSAGWPSNN